MVAGDEVGVEMGLDDVLDLEALLLRGFDVDVDVALGVDDGGDAIGGDEVGGVGEQPRKNCSMSTGSICLPYLSITILLERYGLAQTPPRPRTNLLFWRHRLMGEVPAQIYTCSTPLKACLGCGFGPGIRCLEDQG